MATLRGTTLDDVLSGTETGDIIYGLGNNDDVTSSGADVRLYGGEGPTMSPSRPRDNPTGLISRAYGDGGNDDVGGSNFDDKLYGGTGNDYMIVSAGKDTVDGGDGRDVLVLGSVIPWSEDATEGVKFTLSDTGAGRFARTTSAASSRRPIRGSKGQSAASGRTA